MQQHAAATASSDAQLPGSPEEQVKQACQAAQRALDAGINRMSLEITLPLIGATDLDDWPGGVRQQFKAAGPMVQGFLRGLQPSEAVLQDVLDPADAVVELSSTGSGGTIKAIVFPTADAFNEVERISKEKLKAAVLVNPQWNNSQNIIHDFGFGPWRKAKEDLVATFEEVYSLREVRIRGQIIRVIRSYPGDWLAFALGGGVGSYQAAQAPVLVGTYTKRPSYKEIEELVNQKKDSIANKGWAERAVSEFKFNADSLNEKK